MTRKITVSLPDHAVDAARRAVEEGRAASVSGYVAAALERYEGYEDLDALVADMAAIGGEPTEEAREWARRAFEDD
jgi:antitoxin ParD1/3/4